MLCSSVRVLGQQVGESLEMEGLVLSTHMMGAWDPDRMFMYVVATVVVTILAGMYPAYHLSRLKPVEALRAPSEPACPPCPSVASCATTPRVMWS